MRSQDRGCPECDARLRRDPLHGRCLHWYPSSEQYPWPKPVYYHICLELRRRGTDGQLCHKELEREAGDLLGMWETRVLDGKPIPPISRALTAPMQDRGPTPAETLIEEYQRRKAAGLTN